MLLVLVLSSRILPKISELLIMNNVGDTLIANDDFGTIIKKKN